MVSHTIWHCNHISRLQFDYRCAIMGGMFTATRIASGVVTRYHGKRRTADANRVRLLTRSTYAASITFMASIIEGWACGHPGSTAGRDPRHALADGSRYDP